MADYESLLGIVMRAGVPFEASKDHELLKIGPEGRSILTFNSMGALLSWETVPGSEEPDPQK